MEIISLLITSMLFSRQILCLNNNTLNITIPVRIHKNNIFNKTYISRPHFYVRPYNPLDITMLFL